MGDVARWLIFAGEIILVFLAALYVSANRRPSSAIAWILAFILLPVVGIIAFLFIKLFGAAAPGSDVE
jgi:cardiolipin synthase